MRTLLVAFFSIGLIVLCSDNGVMACSSEPKIVYCDSSTGRNVLTNGDYSSTYCTRRAVMNMQKFQGCCMWNGGVAKITIQGGVACRDGSISESCTLQIPHESLVIY